MPLKIYKSVSLAYSVSFIISPMPEEFISITHFFSSIIYNTLWLSVYIENTILAAILCIVSNLSGCCYTRVVINTVGI